jgi:hypothetical protein
MTFTNQTPIKQDRREQQAIIRGGLARNFKDHRDQLPRCIRETEAKIADVERKLEDLRVEQFFLILTLEAARELEESNAG